MDRSTKKNDDHGVRLVRHVAVFSCLLTVVIAGAGWVFLGTVFALSVLEGGALANVSFLLLKKDVEQLLNRVVAAGVRAEAVSRTEKIRFFIKFYARLIIFGLLLIVLVSKVPVHMIGLSLGLATVMLSVIATVLGRGKHFYSEQSLRSV